MNVKALDRGKQVKNNIFIMCSTTQSSKRNHVTQDRVIVHIVEKM